MGHMKHDAITINEIVSRLGQKLSLVQIANEVNVPYNTVRHVAKKHGFKQRDVSVINRPFGNCSMDAYDVYDDYVNHSMSINEIVTKSQSSKKTISRILKEFGINPKTNRVGRKYKAVRSYVERRVQLKKPSVIKNKKLKKWRETHGRLLIPVYEDIQKGLTIIDACKKHNVTKVYARYHFQRLQDKYAEYLDFGQPMTLKLTVSRERLKQFEWVAKQSHNNVLDWALQTLKAVCDSKDYYNGRNKDNRTDTDSNGDGQESEATS